MYAKDVTKSFGGLVALDGATIKVQQNKVNLLIGANGSGKTTLINVLSGNHRADGGTILLNDKDVTDVPVHGRYQEGMVRTFQSPRLFGSMTVLDNLLCAGESPGERFRHSLMPQKYRKQEKTLTQRARQVLEQLEIAHLEQSLAYDLSGGQIKLLELAKALMSEGSVMLLDEPIAGINPKLAHKIFDSIVRHARTHDVTFLIIEHRLDIAMQYADFVYVMGQGRIIAQDVPDRILEDPAVIRSYLR